LKVPVTQNDHIRGPAHAPITLVEYGDYQSPHCGTAHPIVNQVKLYFRGQMRFVFRHFPLSEMHPYAEVAERLDCSGICTMLSIETKAR
jgi:protein-disulfide isomerase